MLPTARDLPDPEVLKPFDEAEISLERMPPLILRETLRTAQPELTLVISTADIQMPVHCERCAMTPAGHHFDDILVFKAFLSE